MINQFLFANKVIDNKEVTAGKFILSFKKQFGIKAGQVVALTSNRDIVPRIYSLCSGETDPHMQILYDVKEDGELSPKLSRLKQGDRIYVSQPYGGFLPDNKQPMWWIATGTGIAPFYAMFKSNYMPELLVHGTREGAHFYFEQDFKEVLDAKYIRCNSGIDDIGDYFGRVTKFLENYDTLQKNIKYYLCGRAAMVIDVRDLLIAKGVPFENIISEIYF